MRLSKFLSPSSIIIEADPADKWELLDTMSNEIMHSPLIEAAGITRETVIDAIRRREKQSSTGIGNGFAFPHARLSDLHDIAIAIATLKKPLDFESVDKQPVRLACMVLVPEKNPMLALKVISQVGKLFSSESAREKISSAAAVEDVFHHFRESSIDLDIPVTARDIMRPQQFDIHPEMPLKEVTWQMSLNRINAAAVTDSERRLIGEITCRHLFQLGVPDFFSQLKSVAFISEFDPFEKYFHDESESRAGDVMIGEYCAMPPEATLFEIVFALTAKGCQKVYVVEEEKLIGVIDQSAVLDRIINI